MLEARCVLVVDDPKRALGPLALRLIRLGVDSFYALGHHEAWLLAQQEADRIRLVLVPPGLDPNGLAAVLEELETHAPGRSRSLMVTGPQPDEATSAGLREAGVQWALWEPWDESALRMILAGAMATRSDDSDRLHPRLPTTLLGRAFKGIQRCDGLVSSLSRGGAFVEMPYPFTVGTPLTLEIEVGEGTITTRAEVMYAHEAGETRSLERPPGMGVAFRELGGEDRERLERYLAEHERRFQV